MAMFNIEVDILIMSDLKSGMTQKDIAKKYNVSPSYVSKLKNNKKKHYTSNESIQNLLNIDESAFDNTELKRILVQRLNLLKEYVSLYEDILNKLGGMQ